MDFQLADGGLKSGVYRITLRFSQNENAPAIGEALVNIAKKRMNGKA